VAVSVNGTSPPEYIRHRLRIVMDESGRSYVTDASFG
jgi:hypothetical protein